MIGIIFAMEKEACALLNKLNFVRQASPFEEYKTTYNGEEVVAIICGVGKVNAAIATQKLISYSPRIIINAGICGGLDSSMEIGDTYLCDGAIEYDFDLSKIDNVPVGKLDEMESVIIPFTTEKIEGYTYKVIASGDHFYHDEKEIDLIISMGGSLKDMESAAIAHACYKNNQKLVMLKTLSDVRGKDTITQYHENALKACEILTNKLVKLLEKI